MQAKNLHTQADHLLVKKLISLCKIDKDDNELTMQWGYLQLGDQQLPELLLALSEAINFQGDITIDLASNPITDYAIEHIFQLLNQHHFSKSLGICLFDNVWKVKGFNSILAYLTAERCPRQHVYLDLGENALNDQYALLIANVLKKSKLPEKLTLLLSQNNISDKGANTLLEALMNVNDTQVIIHLHENNISKKTEQSMNMCLQNKKNIEIEFADLNFSSSEELNTVEEQNEVLYSRPVFATHTTTHARVTPTATHPHDISSRLTH